MQFTRAYVGGQETCTHAIVAQHARLACEAVSLLRAFAWQACIRVQACASTQHDCDPGTAACKACSCSPGVRGDFGVMGIRAASLSSSKPNSCKKNMDTHTYHQAL